MYVRLTQHRQQYSNHTNIFRQINEIINIGAPGALPSTAGTVTQSSPNSITSAILPTGNTYDLTNGAVTDAGVTPAQTDAADGLKAFTANKGTTKGHSTSALSITGFNIFRKQVADALNVLDAKVRQITSIVKPTC